MIGTNFGIYRPPVIEPPPEVVAEKNQNKGRDKATNLKPTIKPNGTDLYGDEECVYGDLRKTFATRKLYRFVHGLKKYVPTIPDECTQHFLAPYGFHSDDQRLVRLISEASLQFISQVIAQTKKRYEPCRTVVTRRFTYWVPWEYKIRTYKLTMDDLIPVIHQHGFKERRATTIRRNLKQLVGDSKYKEETGTVSNKPVKRNSLGVPKNRSN